MQITVKLFAAYQDAVGTPEVVMDAAVGESVERLRDRLISQYPELARWRDVTRFGVNLEFVEPGTTLQAGDEVVLIPPVSGG